MQIGLLSCTCDNLRYAVAVCGLADCLIGGNVGRGCVSMATLHTLLLCIHGVH